jgi:urate oxidase
VPSLCAPIRPTNAISQQTHIHKCLIDITRLKWSRIPVAGKPHKHSFVRNGDEKRFTSIVVDATAGKDKLSATVSSGIQDLLVLKTTESSFVNYIVDEYTTLQRTPSSRVPSSSR